MEDTKVTILEDTKDIKLKDVKDTKLEDTKDIKSEDARDTKFILSIDGGGFRGLIPAVILNELEQRVTEEIKKDHPDIDVDIRCADLFEIISGTSTGSILALGLSLPDKHKRPKYDAKYIVDFYKEHGYDVFPDYSAVMSVDKLLPKLPEIPNLSAYDMVKSLIGAVTVPIGSISAENNKDIITKNTSESKKSFFNFSWWNKKEKNINNSKKRKAAREFRRIIIINKTKKNKSSKNKLDDTPEITINDTFEDITNATSENIINTTTINSTRKHIINDKSEDTIIAIPDDTITVESEEVASIYKENHHSIWEHLSDLVNAFNPWMPKYPPKGFESLLEKSFKHNKLEETVNDVTVIIPAYNITTSAYTLFTNYNPEYKEHYMKDVIRASAAAPTYFPAKLIGSHYFIDGGVFSNNPTVKAYLEAKKKYPNSKFVVLSLGTGYHKEPLEDYKDCGVIQWIKPLINLLFNSELDNHDNTMKLLADLDGTSYYRIQLKLKEEDNNMDKVSDTEVKKLTDLAHDAIKNPVYKFEEIVALLVDKCKKHNIVPTKTSRRN
ncbi:5382_t:CDS:2 [Cetraspora pellucida]|uniref:5382_t:CDS:1 n=1 Tax=Cetraspora pellucida TaxID=1433469 RepID=A0A9N9FXG3_9GLOM|nr:5382_t:CDS:2 [Cetraspora pellucida]